MKKPSAPPAASPSAPYRGVDSFTAAYPRSKMAEMLAEDDSDEDLPEISALEPVSESSEPDLRPEAAAPVPWMYAVVAIAGLMLLLLAAGGLAAVVLYVW